MRPLLNPWCRWSDLGMALFLGVACGCQTSNYTQRGAAVGGLGGAGVGALIGEVAGDKPLLGAAVGSAVGALTGAAVGTGLDDIAARNDRAVDQALYARAASGTSLDEVVALSRSGLGDDIIDQHIRNQGFYRDLDAADLILLREQGVSNGVIRSLLDASTSDVRLTQNLATSPPPTVVPPPTVYVEEQYYGVPLPFPAPYPRRYPYRHFHPRPGVHWGLSIGR